MTAPSLGRLLISHITLRGPELAQLYALVLAHPSISYDDLAQALHLYSISAQPCWDAQSF